MRKAISFILVVTLVMSMLGSVYAAPAAAEPGINWDVRHHFSFYEDMLKGLAEQYPDIAKTYSIGHSWYERQIWCIELSSKASNVKNKTGIAVLGNIHGGEQESGESAAYTAWWLVNNYSNDKEVKKILDNYTICIVPVINPDGYEQSFVYNNRSNLRPTDNNKDGKVFSDPYKDTNGDGFIAEVYKGAKDSAEKDRVFIGMESPDWDKNGKPGDDPKSSGIDLNRTFDYMWNRLDVDTDPQLGANSLARAGANAASEPEVAAVQNFLITHPVYALVTLHTGIQCVLWPWCYTPEPPADAKMMEGVAKEMAKAFEDTTGRRMYTKQSYDDYPTNAEMIDWAYGRLGIHAYTMEVYCGGKPVPNGTIDEVCTWNNELPGDEWIYIGDWNGLKDIWFKNTTRAQMSGLAPPEQSLMVEGAKNAILKMISSEPKGSGPKVPDYLTWENKLK
ncbi:MAG: M14 family zinc carboxypeptidase [Caulobacteraceae bacterium]